VVEKKVRGARGASEASASERASGEERPASRDPEEPIVIKGGISPSGVPHLGNMNEVMRGYFVAEVLRDRGHEVRQVFTADDRDPLPLDADDEALVGEDFIHL
jgi:lysyl-tRNA synthetase class 1